MQFLRFLVEKECESEMVDAVVSQLDGRVVREDAAMEATVSSLICRNLEQGRISQ